MNLERRLLGLLAPVRGDMVLGIALAAATLVAGIALAAASAHLISRASLVTTFVEVAALVTAVRAFAIARAGMRYTERYVTHRATLRLLARLRSWTFAAMAPRLPAVSGQTSSGDLLAALGADIDTLDRFYLRGLVPPIAALVAGICAVVILAIVAPALGVVLALGLLVAGLVVPLVTRRLARPLADRLVTDRARLHAALADELSGAAELIAYEAPAGFGGRFGAATAALRRSESGLAAIRGGGEGVATLVATGAALIVVGLAVPLVTAGRVEGVLLAVLPLVALAAFEGVQPLASAMEQREASRAAAARVFEIVDAPPPIPDPLQPGPALTRRGIELSDIEFRYGADDPLVLAGLSVAIPEGGRVAVMGPSGSGKSTIAGLLVRFLEPSGGRLCIGGADVRDSTGDEVRALIAVVPQHPYLFHGTIRDNLLVARGDASDAQLREALAIAQLDPFVATFPMGLDTMVGEDGLRLSGGERQRVAIARMILKDAPIVILDEATAHLDADTERDVVAALDRFLRGRTTLILAHRSRLLDLADARLELAG